jgi:hypothetical protein
MNKILTLTGVALATLALAACSPGINEGIGHRITFDSSGMVVHAIGKPDAHIGKDGSLAINDRAIDVTPTQRAMLQRYYQQAGAVMSSGKAISRQGVQMATHGIGAAIRSIFHGDSGSADKQLDAQSQQIESAASTLCTDIKAFGSTQQAIAAEIPAFAPYASGAQTECKVTHTTTIRTAAGNSTTTSSTYTLQVGNPPAATAAPTSSRQASTSGKPGAPTSSEP